MGIRGNYTRQIDTTQYPAGQIKSILKEIGLEITSEPGNDIMFYCPFHSNRHSASCCISSISGAWLCYNPSCGQSGNLTELVRRVSGKNNFQVLRLIAAKSSYASDNFEELLNSVIEDKPEFDEFSQETLDKLYNNLKLNNKAILYLNSRKIDIDSINYFKLGYSENMNMITTPVHSPDGIPIGIVGRSIEGKVFKNSTNLPKSKTLFNIHRAKKTGGNVIVCESNFDAIRIHQAGFPNVVATLGGFLSKEQQYLLNKYFNRITIMTDSDQAGRELGLSISNKLKNKDILWSSLSYGKIYPNNAKDAGDLSEEEIKTCIRNAVSDIEYKSWNL